MLYGPETDFPHIMRIHLIAVGSIKRDYVNPDSECARVREIAGGDSERRSAGAGL